MDLSTLFDPASIAVVGASEDSRRLGGGLVLRFLRQHGYRGTILPVNPRRTTVDGLPCYPSLAAAPGPIDLAVLAVPAAALAPALAEVRPGHVRVALVLSSGFSELGPEGTRLERAVVDIARERGIALVGPNSVGAVNLANGTVPTISQFFDRPRLQPGPLALVTQSGAFGTALLAQAEQEGLRFGYFVSSGNEADLEFSDFGMHLVGRDDVGVLCGYIESIRNGAAFRDMAQTAAAAGKPVVLLKVGSSEAGAEAARSHTGALAGSDTVAQAVFDADGVLRARDGEDLLDLVKVFARTTASGGRRLAILSHSGGAGVMAADAAGAAGALLPPLPEDLRRRLAERLPLFAALRNPLDMTGGASLDGRLMADCLRMVLEHEAYDAALLCVNLIWRDGDALMSALERIAAEVAKPFAVSWVAPRPEARQALSDASFPVFGDPARAARVLVRRMVWDDARHERLSGRSPERPFPAERVSGIDLSSVGGQMAALAACGIRFPHQDIVGTLAEAERVLDAVGGTVAVKIASPDIAHRSEIGAVRTGLADHAALAEAYRAVLANARHHHPQARIDGVLVQEMVEGLEVLVGTMRDPTFGPVVVFGPGGVLVELMGGTTMIPAPFDAEHALRLIGRSRLAPLLAGYRGGPRLDVPALAQVLEAVSWLACDRQDLRELDLNPVTVLREGRGCVALDVAMRCEEG